MTCGIYKISFPNTDQVYIGQSNDCNRRLSEHKKHAKAGVWPKKLQEMYNIHKTFYFEVILECEEPELNYLENLAIELYDSFNSGFNSLPTAENMPKVCFQGEEHGNSLYSNDQIRQVLDLLTDYKLSFDEISKITKVNRSTVSSISRGIGHTWLKQASLEKWNTVQQLRPIRQAYLASKGASAESKGIVYPKIKSPSGEVFVVTNVRAFAREHSLDGSALAKVLKRVKNYNSLKGWTVVTE